MVLERELIDPATGLELTWRLYDRGMSIRLGRRTEPLLFVTVWLAREARVGLVKGDGTEVAGSWHLRPERFLPRDWPDPFACLIDAAGDRQGRLPTLSRLRLRRRVGWLADQAARRCDPAARELALRFSPGDRFEVYRALVADRTGWLAQLVEACPGALLLANDLRSSRDREERAVGERLLGRLRDGERLDRALDAAFCARRVELPDLGDHWFVLDAHCHHPGEPDVQRLVRARRLLVRRAGPRVPAWVLRRPPPVGLVPEDIPAEPRANARWYRVMVGMPDLADGYGLDPRPELVALSRLVSGQVDGLLAAPPRKLSPGIKLVALRDFVLATRRVPARDGRVPGLLAEALRWHEDLHREPGEGGWRGWPWDREAEAGKALSPDAPLPMPANLPPPGPDLVVRPLDTVGALIDEGHRMHHCVATRARDVSRGLCHLLSVEARGEPLTVELVPRHPGLRVGDVRGRCNRDPTPEEWAVLRPWLDAVVKGKRA